MMENVDLFLASQEELIEELFRRNKTVVVLIEDERHVGSLDATFHYQGGVSAAIGLCERMKSKLLVGDFNP